MDLYVGMKVKMVKKDYHDCPYGWDDGWGNNGMNEYYMKVVTITEISHRRLDQLAIKIAEDDGRYTWSEDCFEYINQEDTEMENEVKLPETLMVKDITYELTDEEREMLMEEGTELLDWCDCNYNPTEFGMNEIFNEWARQNGWMIELFKKSPNYVNGKFYIKLPKTTLTRPVDKQGIDKFKTWARSELENAYSKRELRVGLFTYGEYRNSISTLEYILSRLDYYNDELVTYRGTPLTEIREELRRRRNRISDIEVASLNGTFISPEDYREWDKLDDVYAYLSVIYSRMVNEEDKSKGNQLRDSEIEWINDKLSDTSLKVRAKKGQKITKFYGAISKEIGINKVINICTEYWTDDNGESHSRQKDMGYNYHFALLGDSINPYDYDRDIIISVNPIDFWTMSFGLNWASCHTIDKYNLRKVSSHTYEGCYSSGTESYMLDNSSFIVYVLPSESEIERLGEADKPDELKSKLKRCVFMMGEDKLIQSRVYPDGRDGGDEGLATQLRNIVQKVIADLLDTPNMWTLKKGNTECGKVVTSRGTHYRDYTSYGDGNVSYLRRIDGLLNENRIIVGADPICPHCGERHDEEKWITCPDCNDEEPYARCERCDSRINENDDYIETDDGHYYCCAECAWDEGYRRPEDYDYWVHTDDLVQDEYTGDYYYYEDDGCYTEEGYWYANDNNAECDGNEWCVDIDRYSSNYTETVNGKYYYYTTDLIEIDGEYYENAEQATEAGFVQNEDGEWIAA